MTSAASFCAPRRLGAAGVVVVTIALPTLLLTPAASAVAGRAAAPAAALSPATATNGAASSGDWWFDKLRVADAHRTSTGAGTVIALIDGPTDPTVPALVGQRLVPVRSFCGPTAPLTSRNQPAEHATQIARLLIGNGRDGRAPGIAPDATLRSYVVDLGLDEAQCITGGSDGPYRDTGQNIARAIDAAVADRVDVISISLGFAESDESRAALRSAYAAGIPVVAAAGNLGGTTADVAPGQYPASDPTVVCVTATTEQATSWPRNVTGPYTMVAAPGDGLAAGTRRPDETWDPTGLVSGTSFSTPLVAGALALVKARYPGATRNQLVRHLVTHTSATRLYQSRDLGFGILSLARLLGDDPRRQPDDDPFAAHGIAGADIAALAAARPVSALVPAPRAATGSDSAGGVPVLPIAGGGVVLAAAGGATLLTRRRRQPKEA